MKQVYSRCLSFVGLWLYVLAACAQVPRGESTGAMWNEDALGALWIFAAVAIYAAFKNSKQSGYKVLGFFAVLGVVFVLSPTVGGILVGLLGLVVGVSFFMKMK